MVFWDLGFGRMGFLSVFVFCRTAASGWILWLYGDAGEMIPKFWWERLEVVVRGNLGSWVGIRLRYTQRKEGREGSKRQRTWGVE